ncbi:GUN4 domain-containing protein, partial [Anabaena sp. UHCC 0204]|uniref:GUN4 domain-containing protein n=1 Tax=Anabaena sp. UHCC 0204 TaxID=2590009 RepID=UPI00352EB555
MDWTTILKAQQTDFIQRLKSGELLHCEKEGQHSELTVISGERLKQLRDFCWEMANKFKQQYDVKNIFFNNMKGKLGEEVVKIRLGDFVTEIDYEKRIGGDGKIDFTLTSDSSIGIQVKTRYGYFDKVQWTIDREEIEKNAVLVCVLCQEEFSDMEKEYGLIIAGFLPTNMMKSTGDKTLVGIDELLYPGGLRGYLENLSFYDADKYINLGDECIVKEDYQGAITNYSQALQINPKNAQIYFKRAEIHHHLGNFQNAINDYSQAIYINPKDAYSYNNRGIIYENFGYINHAINDYEKALKINSKEAVIYLNLAITYYNLDVDCNYYNYIINRDELIINYLNQALNINPNLYKAYYVRGKFRFQIGDVSGAFEDFNIVLKFDPDYALNIYTYLAEVYYYRGNYYSEIGNNKNALENLNLAANLYKRINNKFSYGSTINYIQYVQSKYFEYNFEDDEYYQLILNSTNKSLEVNNVDLKSAVGMNYTRLRDLLAAGKWKEADEETRRVMLAVAKREREGWLDTKSIDNFPCEDLLTIDQLWVKYSDGKFGFSVQTKIYQSLGGTTNYNGQIWAAFGDKVGWRKGGSWLRYSYITFDKRSPEGHLPVCIRLSDVGGWLLGGAVFFRVETCNLFPVQERQPQIISTPQPVNQEVQLKSSRGMDYIKLRDLLKAGNWKEADEETERVMLAVAKREKQGWLDDEDIDNFPYEDLRTIDQLWVKYSDGRFGFSVPIP